MQRLRGALTPFASSGGRRPVARRRLLSAAGVALRPLRLAGGSSSSASRVASALPAPMAEPGAALLRIGVLALRDDAGGDVSAGWWAQLCVAGQAGEEVVADGRRASFNMSSRQGAVDVHVYRGEIGAHALVGVTRLSLAELGLSAAGGSWRTTWVALHRRRRCAGSWQLQLCEIGRAHV